MYKRLMLAIVAVGLMALACKKDEEDKTQPGVQTTDIACSDVDFTFSSGIKPIIANSCALSGCHAAPGRSGVVLETYEQIRDNANQARFLIAIKRTRENGVSPMPQSSALAPEKVKAIECWIEAGTPDN